MATGITFSGLASGIDTSSIIDKLMSLERKPQDDLKNQVLYNSGRNDVYSTLNSRLASLKDIVNEFDDVANPFFEQKEISSSDPSVAAAAITGSYPAMGNFSIDVSALATAAMASGSEAIYTGADSTAQAAVFASAGGVNAPSFTVDPTQSLASQSGNFAVAPQTSGTITINGESIDWDDSMSLNEIMGKINNANAGVTATFDQITQTFSLTSTDTGAEAEITVSQSSGNLWDMLQITPGTVQGTDAVTPDITKAVGSADAHLDTAVTSGTFTINGVIFTVDAATDTLQSVLGRINNSSAGVNVSYDTSTHRVTLYQKETGSSNQIVLGGTDDTSNFLFAMKLSGNNPPVGGAGDTYSGTDAQVSLNGGAVQSYDSNAVQGLIPGVSLSLKSTGAATVNVAQDVDGMVATVKDFVNQYNNVLTYINTKLSETKVDSPSTVSDKLQGAFVGDSLILDAKSDLISAVTAAAPDLTGTLKHLSQIGIDTTSDNYGEAGTLVLDEDKLRAALESNPDQVEALLNDPDEGIMTKMKEQITAMTDPIYGSFTLEQKSLTDINSDINQRISDMENRLTKKEDQLKLEFAAMEGAVQKLNTMGTAMTNMLAKLG